MTTLRGPNGELEAEFHPEAGMVCASLRIDGDELLGLRGGLAAYVERASTFGIPLLHPWANRLSGDEYLGVHLGDDVKRDGNGLPIHGLIAGLPFEVLEEREHSLTARFDGAAIAESFPFPHTLTLTVAMHDAGFTLTSALAATGDEPVPAGFGFHPYFACDPDDTRIELPVRKHVMLDDRGLPTGEVSPMEPLVGPLGLTAYDDLYTEVVGRFALETRGRRITVGFEEGYPYAQVYAPRGEGLVCFEPMTAPTNALVTGDGLRFVEPGETLNARFSVRVA